MVFGGWNAYDFRLPPEDGYRTGLLVAASAVAFAYGVVQMISRRHSFVIIATFTMLGVYVLSLPAGAYFSAKSLVLASPFVLLASFKGLSDGVTIRTVLRSTDDFVRAMGFVVLLVIASSSTWKVLSEPPIESNTRDQDLRGIRHLTENHPTIYIGQDYFADTKLRGSPASVVWGYGAVDRAPVAQSRTKPPTWSGLTDWDSVAWNTLDQFDYAVVTRSAFSSDAPDNWYEDRTTRFYRLFRRNGQTKPRSSIETVTAPGRELDCSEPSDHRLSLEHGIAHTRDAPRTAHPWVLVGTKLDPRPRPGFRISAMRYRSRVTLPRGTWEVSLQYNSNARIDFRLGNRHIVMPASPDVSGEYWHIGTIEVNDASVVRLTAVAEKPRFTSLHSPVNIGELVFQRTPNKAATVPLHSACNMFVDWYRRA
jgi:hypothetical protein